MAIVALILAADFFLVKPNIEWNVKYLDRIDRSKVEEAYRKESKEIPAAVTDAIASFLSGLDYNKQTGIIETNNFLITKDSAPEDQYVFYLVDYLTESSLSSEDVWFAWSAIRDATTTVGKIVISNTGDAPATKIQIITPPPFFLTNPATHSFDLAPRESVTVLMDAGQKYGFSLEYLWGDNPGQLPNVVVVWDTSFGVVNKRLFILLSGLALAIWMSVIGREIWFTKGE